MTYESAIREYQMRERRYCLLQAELLLKCLGKCTRLEKKILGTGSELHE